MELDDLKQQWKQAHKTQVMKNHDIMNLIHQRRTGPLAALKKGFKTRIIAMIVVPIAIIGTNLQHIEKTLTSVLFWFYILFCIAVIIFARLNYGIVKRMEEMDGMVKSNLEQQISLLETRIRQNLIGIRIALLVFVVLTEVLPYFQYFKMLNTWHSLSPFTRFGAYAALFLFQYFISGTITRRKFGRHIAYLKEIVKQMQ